MSTFFARAETNTFNMKRFLLLFLFLLLPRLPSSSANPRGPPSAARPQHPSLSAASSSVGVVVVILPLVFAPSTAAAVAAVRRPTAVLSVFVAFVFAAADRAVAAATKPCFHTAQAHDGSLAGVVVVVVRSMPWSPPPSPPRPPPCPPPRPPPPASTTPTPASVPVRQRQPSEPPADCAGAGGDRRVR